MKENFKKNVDKLLEFSNKKNEKMKYQEMNFKTGYYSMSVNVNYNKIIDQLNILKQSI